jgi:hypothetical protein
MYPSSLGGLNKRSIPLRTSPILGLALTTLGAGVACALFLLAPFALADVSPTSPVDPHQFQFIKRESGPVNYYTVVDDPAGGAYIHADYQPPLQTAVLGYEIPEKSQSSARLVRWRWRAVASPKGGDECAAGREDSAAVVYVFWKRDLHFYALKYVWSTVGTKGAVCGRKRNLFLAQDTIILETGGPLKTWINEQIDLKAEFRSHFAGGKEDAPVPPLVGLGIMSDGDQTKSESVADYERFTLVP